MRRFQLSWDGVVKAAIDACLSVSARAGIVRGLSLFLTLGVARRTLSDANFVLLAQVLAVCLLVGSVATARTRGARVSYLLAASERDPSERVRPEPRAALTMTLVGLMGALLLLFSPTMLAYNSRPDDMVAAVFFAAAFYRAPYQLAQSFAPQLTALLAERRLSTVPLVWLAPVGLIAALFAAGFGALVGPLLFDFLAGDGELLRRPTHSGIAAAGTVGAINYVGALALVRREQYSATVWIWAIPAAIVAYPVYNATEPDPLFQAVQLYVAMVYIGQLWVWSRIGPLANATTRASLRR